MPNQISTSEVPPRTERQGRLGRADVPSHLLPTEVVGDIFSKAQEQSILMTLGKQINVSMGETVIRYGGEDPEAGQVGGTTLASREGATKPVSGFGFGTEKSFAPIKLATIVTVSQEFMNADPERLYSELAGKLASAVSRAADLAVFHNVSALTGAALVGTTNNSFVNATTNRVELNFAAGTSLYDQLLAGVDLIVDQDDKTWDVTGFAADPTYRTKLARARDEQGNVILTQGASGGLALTQGPINLNAQLGDLLGVPVAYGRSVRGRVGNYAGTATRMFAGDWSQLAYGFADQISVKVSDQATVAGVSMWETNQVAILAEATFGWIVNDTSAFVAFDDAVVDAPPTP